MQAWKHTAVAHMFSMSPRVGAMPAGISHLSKKLRLELFTMSVKQCLRNETTAASMIAQ